MNNYITALRDIVPLRSLTAAETLRVAERQATKLVRLVGLTEPPLPELAISEVRRVQIERAELEDAHAASRWVSDRWVIMLNSTDNPERQRWSLAHEFKHILDNPFADVIYRRRGDASRDQVEQACEYFAGCLLMPGHWLRATWKTGLRDPQVLAEQFAVSPHAMRVRLLQLGLIQPTSHHLTREA